MSWCEFKHSSDVICIQRINDTEFASSSWYEFQIGSLNQMKLFHRSTLRIRSFKLLLDSPLGVVLTEGSGSVYAVEDLTHEIGKPNLLMPTKLPPLDLQNPLDRLKVAAKEKNNCRSWNEWIKEQVTEIDLQEAQLDGVDLSGARFQNCNFRNASFCNTKLDDVFFNRCNLTDAKFNFATSSKVRFTSTGSYSGCPLQVPTILAGTRFDQCKFTDVSFRYVKLSDAYFNWAEFDQVQFDVCDLSYAAIHGKIGKLRLESEKSYLKKVSKYWQPQVVDEKDRVGSELRDVDFSQTELVDAKFSKRQMPDANFEKSILNNCNFKGANLKCSDFREATVTDCDFRDADFSQSYFGKATFINCKFKNANFNDTDFDQAKFEGCSGM